MADEKKISGLTEATDASASDEFVVVNKDVTTGQDASVSGQTSKITLDNLRNAILGGSSGSTGNDVIFDGNVEIRSSEANQEALLLLAEGDNDSGGIEFSVLDSSTYKHTITHNDVGLVFDNNSANSAASLRHYVFSNGNVGIGTDSPGSTLHIAGVPVISGQLKSLLHLEDTQPQDENGDSGGGISFGGIYNDQGEQATYGAIWAGKKTTAEDGNFGGKLYLMARTHGDTALEPDLTIDSNGNVGIGTSNPNAKLSVGTSETPDNSTYTSAIFQYGIEVTSSADSYLALTSQESVDGKTWEIVNNTSTVNGVKKAGYLSIGHDAQVLCLTQDNNVGIGTSTPNANLEVRSSGPNVEATLLLAEGDDFASGIKFSTLNSSTYQHTIAHNDTGLVFDNTSSPSTQRHYAFMNGDVGIGTTSPEGYLHITGNHNGAIPLIVDRGTFATKDENGNHLPVVGGFVWQEFRHNDITDWWIGGQVDLDGDGTDYSNLTFRSKQTDIEKSVLTLGQSGRVGIGTTLPQCALHLEGNTNDSAQIRFINTDPIQSNVADFAITAISAGEPVLAIRYVHHATSSERRLLTVDVDGNVHVKSNLTTTGTASSLGFDADNLDNVRATDANGLDSINNLVVSDFEKDGVTKTGIVAQDMQKVLPQSVSGGDEYEYVAEATGRVVSGLGTDDEHEHCYDITKSQFDSDETYWGDGAEFIEINAEESETRNRSLATSNDELIATLVKAVQELSAKVDELSK